VASIRRYLIAGLLIWVPLIITVLVIKVLVDVLDRSLLLLPPSWRPEALLGFDLPGLGILLTLLIVFVTGLIVANLLGRKLVGVWEGLLARIPLVRSVYSASKQVMETVFGDGSKAFRKVLLIEYPRRGAWTLAFQTGRPIGEIQGRTEADLVTVFVPTTPNPTSGFVIFVPAGELIELEMSVEEALKLLMSLGVISPPAQPAPQVAPPGGNS
jgi:uncharacterized membrane protein